MYLFIRVKIVIGRIDECIESVGIYPIVLCEWKMR
jgi:hypothetical protein